MDKSTYIPGVCNIGETEIKQRRRIGWIGLTVTVIGAVVLDLFHVPFGWKLLLFFPAAFGATGFLQAGMHFCAGFGMQGVFNFSTELRKTDTVAQAEFRAQDRRTALRIFAYSIIIGAIVTALICLWK